jgi:geranylgeranyl reductase family protein
MSSGPAEQIYDALIVGAGPAGCAAAYDLAKAGKRVLLLDRRTFPRHKACACGLTRKTLKALRYSVDPIVERVCREIVLQQHADEPKHREIRVRTRNPICAMAVRETFDAYCLNQTLAAGAQLRQIHSIQTIHETPDRIALTILTESGPETLTAPILIGADGSNGQTRRLSQPEARWYTRGFALEATVPYTALTNLPAGTHPQELVFDFAPLPGGYGWLFPKGDHINIGVGAFAPENPTLRDEEKLKQVTRTLLNHYTQQKLGLTPTHITGQHLGMGGHNYTPQGRILLVGDAAGLVDPLTGEGIHSAIVSGQAAAAAILSPSNENIAAKYATQLRPLQDTLAFSHRAAKAFYKQPQRGFRAMRMPILRTLVLKTYADGLPHTALLGKLAAAVV